MNFVIPCSVSSVSLIPGHAFPIRKNRCITRFNYSAKSLGHLSLPSQRILLHFPTTIRAFPRCKIGCASHYRPKAQRLSDTGTELEVEEQDLSTADEEPVVSSEEPSTSETNGDLSSSKSDARSSPARSKRPRAARKSDMPPVKNEDLVPGATFTGKVRSIQPFGAFVDFGAFTDGLVHVSRLSNNFVKDVASFVSVGQEVKVRLVEVNTGAGRIALSMRENDDKGKQTLRKDASSTGGEKGKPSRRNNLKGNQKKFEVKKASKFVKGQDLLGTVKNLTRSGAFITLPEGEEGFLPASEESDDGVPNIMGGSSLEIGQEVNVRVLRIIRGQVTLTMKKEEDLQKMDLELSQGVVHSATNPFVLAFRMNEDISAFLDEREKLEEGVVRSSETKVEEATKTTDQVVVDGGDSVGNESEANGDQKLEVDAAQSPKIEEEEIVKATDQVVVDGKDKSSLVGNETGAIVDEKLEVKAAQSSEIENEAKVKATAAQIVVDGQDKSTLVGNETGANVDENSEVEAAQSSKTKQEAAKEAIKAKQLDQSSETKQEATKTKQLDQSSEIRVEEATKAADQVVGDHGDKSLSVGNESEAGGDEKLEVEAAQSPKIEEEEVLKATDQVLVDSEDKSSLVGNGTGASVDEKLVVEAAQSIESEKDTATKATAQIPVNGEDKSSLVGNEAGVSVDETLEVEAPQSSETKQEAAKAKQLDQSSETKVEQATKATDQIVVDGGDKSLSIGNGNEANGNEKLEVKAAQSPEIGEGEIVKAADQVVVDGKNKSSLVGNETGASVDENMEVEAAQSSETRKEASIKTTAQIVVNGENNSSLVGNETEVNLDENFEAESTRTKQEAAINATDEVVDGEDKSLLDGNETASVNEKFEVEAAQSLETEEEAATTATDHVVVDGEDKSSLVQNKSDASGDDEVSSIILSSNEIVESSKSEGESEVSYEGTDTVASQSADFIPKREVQMLSFEDAIDRVLTSEALFKGEVSAPDQAENALEAETNTSAITSEEDGVRTGQISSSDGTEGEESSAMTQTESVAEDEVEMQTTKDEAECKISSATPVEAFLPEKNGNTANSNGSTGVIISATISAALVKQLREETGAGMMDCKKALSESGGDLVKAQEFLRKKGLASAEKKASRTTAEGRIGSYIHDSRIGVLIEVNCETDFVSRGEIFKELVDDLAMQVAACPQVEYLVPEDVPKGTVEREREIEMQKEDLLLKPEQIRGKIVEGRIKKRLDELALLEQPYIKNDKVLVKDWVKQTIATIGENIKVKRFVKYNLGEGLEKKSQDFAAEVAAQTTAQPVPGPPKGEQPAAAEPEKPAESTPKVAVSAALVKQLREETGAGMMDCKKALSETGGDLVKAQEYLRKKGLSTADKKSSRLAAEGRIGSYIHDSRIGVLIEVNCETDFVGRSEKFKELVDDLAMQVAACPQVKYVSIDDMPESIRNKEKEIEMQREDILSKPENIREKIVEGRVLKRLGELALLEQPFIKDDSVLVKDLVKQTVAAIGENIKVRRFARFTIGEKIDEEKEDEAPKGA